MPSLLDIAPPEIAGKEVTIRGITLPLRGVRAIEWAQLYARFPELRRLVVGRTNGEPDQLQMVAAQCALIAAGTGHIGSADIERAAMVNLTTDEQRALIDDILKLSLPGDMLGPLLDAEGGSGDALSTAEPDTK